MDAGCGPGGTALQLCQDFKHVEAYDYSQGFVDMMLAKKTEKVCCVLSSPLSGKEDKGTCQKSFSGFCPLRGGVVPPFSAKEKILLFFTLIFR